MQQTDSALRLPPIGQPESYYAKRVHHADRHGHKHVHEAYKVGQYVTLGLNPRLAWDAKYRYFRHALRRHCAPPPLPGEDIWEFYQQLADLVRCHAGIEALRLAARKDDELAERLAAGERRDRLADEAEQFFTALLGATGHRPDHFSSEDWEQLTLIRDQWV